MTQPNTTHNWHAVWCMSDGVTTIVSFGNIHDAYDYYCSNPYAYHADELKNARWRGVISTMGLITNIARDFVGE